MWGLGKTKATGGLYGSRIKKRLKSSAVKMMDELGYDVELTYKKKAAD